jgi:predicted heme/steroid binding protein
MSYIISDYIHQVALFIDSRTGVKGCTGYILIFLVLWISHCFFSGPSPRLNMDEQEQRKEQDPDPPRNFTARQLAYFDGTKDEKSGESKPVYLSVNGTVFDVTDGRNFYGPEGMYEVSYVLGCGNDGS